MNNLRLVRWVHYSFVSLFALITLIHLNEVQIKRVADYLLTSYSMMSVSLIYFSFGVILAFQENKKKICQILLIVLSISIAAIAIGVKAILPLSILWFALGFIYFRGYIERQV
ncbi:hypothetical protein [Pleionea sp. CnH1-48]|uniref:hypothetical protein n=1 Tax=Pleionea sp. CnH1-48 TaxID=2954494 RepID=UPI00209771E1|nr:hypothetical protein [Pleionea sp. CnH1-48]MCO7225280.1 hypothetical protein [Pleionea sp. CnH1-48]